MDRWEVLNAPSIDLAIIALHFGAAFLVRASGDSKSRLNC
jgi:hypothetical protein